LLIASHMKILQRGGAQLFQILLQGEELTYPSKN
jgi:hypothetical protein